MKYMVASFDSDFAIEVKERYSQDEIEKSADSTGIWGLDLQNTWDCLRVAMVLFGRKHLPNAGAWNPFFWSYSTDFRSRTDYYCDKEGNLHEIYACAIEG